MNSKQCKRICVIGSGASGITAIKECIGYGLDVVCYEKSTYFGGQWNFSRPDTAIIKSTIINSSKEMTAFSDFPPAANVSNYMHNTAMLDYIRSYATKYDVLCHVNYNHEVLKVKEHNGAAIGWQIKVKNHTTDQVTTEIFDAVMVCIGHHSEPRIPTFEGQERFQGKIIHSKDYKTPLGMEDKRVVVLGLANTGGDIAAELATVSKQVYLSFRTGKWMVFRVGPRGLPSDISFVRRFSNWSKSILGNTLSSRCFELFLNMHFNHKLYGLNPKHRLFNQQVFMNDTLPSRILSGTVAVKGAIKAFTKSGVIFEGEERETPCDVVILATGFLFSFPFLDPNVLHIGDNGVDLYRQILSPKYNSLGIIGLVEPLGPVFPILEMQNRWFLHQLLDESKKVLPSEEKMMLEIEKSKISIKKRFKQMTPFGLEVDTIEYMDILAHDIGVKPNLYKLFFKDIRLWTEVVFGPYVSYQYRLQGSQSWTGARDAILTSMDRVKAPLLGQQSNKK